MPPLRMEHAEDEHWMRRALDLARNGMGNTSPNPMVGAVIVHDGREVAAAWHEKAGLPHAEAAAIRLFAQLRRPPSPRQCTLYVTLEPCSTTGRTPPCTEAILRAGFGRVVVGAIDPNPRHSGRGIFLLRDAGVETISGVCAADCLHLNRAFNKWIVTGLPWVVAKVALTLDGQLTRPDQRWLSTAASRRRVHEMRREVDAILVGSGAVRKDNPRLTVRAPHTNPRRQPWRVVLGSAVPSGSRILTDIHRHRTLVMGHRSPLAVLKFLGQKEALSVLVEGGGAVLGSFIDEDLIDEVHIFLTPAICAGEVVIGGRGVRFRDLRGFGSATYSRIGDDVLCSAIRQRH